MVICGHKRFHWFQHICMNDERWKYHKQKQKQNNKIGQKRIETVGTSVDAGAIFMAESGEKTTHCCRVVGALKWECNERREEKKAKILYRMQTM